MKGLALAALADACRGGSFSVGLELIDFATGLGEDSVDVDLHAGGFAAAVVGHEDVLVGRVNHVTRGHYLDRVVGPLADDVDAEVAAGLEEVPALGALRVVHPSDDRTGAFDLVGLDPGGGGECLLGAEVAGGADDEMRTLLEDWRRTDLAGLVPGHGLACGGGAGWDALAFVEGEAGDESLGRDVCIKVGGLGRREPLLEKRRAELAGRGDLFVALGDLGGQDVPARTVGVGREVEHWALAVLHVAIEAALGGVPEEGRHRVEVLL